MRACNCFLLTALALAPAALAQRSTLSLHGEWRFRLDPEDAGERERWFAGELPDRIRLPGSLQERGFGNEVSVDSQWTGSIVDRSWFDDPRYEPYRGPGEVKVPFWLQPERHYVGAAWYQREVEVPPEWSERRILLSLERCHWLTRLWVDGRQVGSCDSLSTPHEYDLTGVLAPGRRRITIRVDNRLAVDVGVNAHSVSDHTQSNWNGITGAVDLITMDRAWIEDAQVHPDLERRAARVLLEIGSLEGESGEGWLTLSARHIGGDPRQRVQDLRAPVSWGGEAERREVVLPLGSEVARWDEHAPELYRLELRLEGRDDAGPILDELSLSFGMREIAARGRQLTINGRPAFLRGTLECCIFPLTGYPPTDVESWRRIVRTCQAHGLNHIRFHSWCPPEAAFVAADELGFYYQVECAAWCTVGDGQPVDAWLYREAERILAAYGNHPSFALMAYGNEPGGAEHRRWLGEWVDYWKERDPRRLHTSAAGWPILPQNQFHDTPSPRIQHWGAGLKSRINAHPPETLSDYRSFIEQHRVPVISHEIGQWCVHPDFEEIPKYTGVLKPRNFEVFRDRLAANHMGDLAEDFLWASGRLQVLCYKEEIESALRTPQMGGFQLLDLHDFPGQGTALVGVLDPFWDSKPYVSPQEWRRFCGPTVPLARMARRTWRTDETFEAEIELAHFGPEPMAVHPVWLLATARGTTVQSRSLPRRIAPVGNGTALGSVEVPLRNLAPGHYRLVVSLLETGIENDWDIWVFPAELPEEDPSEGPRVVRGLGPETEAALRAGERVLLLMDPGRVHAPSTIGFSSVFWNTAWTRGQVPHTLGILCDPTHPAFADFPTDYHSDWQWWELIHGSAAMGLDGLPADLRPLVQPIDTWFEARRLGLLFEARVEGGRLMVCSMDLSTDLERRIVARQMRHSLLAYASGESFDPPLELSIEQLRGLFRPLSPLERLGATVAADSEAEGFEAGRAIDGDPATLWHTPWGEAATPLPHHLVIDLKEAVELEGLVLLPRQDMDNGRIADFAVHSSEDGRSWGEPLAEGRFPNSADPQRIRLERPIRTRFLRIEARSEVRGRPFASLAELSLHLGDD